MIDRQTNFLFAYVLLLVYVLAAQTNEQLSILLGIALSVLTVSIVFLLGFLSLEALIPAALVGSIAYGLGGIPSVGVLGVFFVSSSLLTLVNDQRVRKDELNESRRGGRQVWSNAFWFVSFLISSFILDSMALTIASISALATSSADTWGTEAGLFPKQKKTISITRFTEVQPGTDGGVSLFGTLASLVGSALIGGFFAFFFSEKDVYLFLIITFSGFIGSLIDSILGDRFQSTKGSHHDHSKFKSNIQMSNNMVNWFSTGFGGLIGLILYYLLQTNA
jgi:uncharacterized protein (TIGR00297 family)